jgi:hypothetical protein
MAYKTLCIVPNSTRFSFVLGQISLIWTKFIEKCINIKLISLNSPCVLIVHLCELVYVMFLHLKQDGSSSGLRPAGH